jgi:shikimate 5-dehydrogenase
MAPKLSLRLGKAFTRWRLPREVDMIGGATTLIVHLGFPTESFKASMIYNPYFEKAGIDAVVVPMGVRAEHYPQTLKALFQVTNIRGALVTMPHKSHHGRTAR